MKLKNAFKMLRKEHTSDVMHPLYTPWGENLDADHTWEEYPRPQMQRDNYYMLNGCWDYKIIPIRESAENISPGIPFQPDGPINVPFSPESLLSGVGRQLKPDEYLWYQRILLFSQKENYLKDTYKRRCLLHFDAVDQQAEVYIDGKLVQSHSGGYLPFTIDITDHVNTRACLLQVRVQDESDTSYHARGKQTLKRGGMFYTAQSGIWQSVWYEWVPDNHIRSMKITPDYDGAAVEIQLTSLAAFENLSVTIYSPTASLEVKNQEIQGLMELDPLPSRYWHMEILPSEQQGSAEASITACLRIEFLQPFLSWTPDNPFLYPFKIAAGSDNISSYFAMRCYTIEADSQGIQRFCLNHSPCFLHGVLDQGYWPDGLMTAPCDEAFLYDIKLCKSLGFNMIRKHIKIEPLRWYYHCDRLGMLVWQDMVNGGRTYRMSLMCYLPTIFPNLGTQLRDHRHHLFSRSEKEGRDAWEAECMETLEHLHNICALSAWVPFNEGWGQFDAERITGLIKEKDPSRTIDHASGWFDQNAGDFKSVHNYFRPLQVKTDEKRAFVISEYGGYACHVKGHSSVDRIYGYQKYESSEALSAAYHKLMETLFDLQEKGLSGAVYTQLSDIEEEVNGLVTYDRKVVKINI